MRLYKIYCILCLKNNKRYIGLTKRTIEKRWRQHKYDAKMGSEHLFHRALRKYGFESFKIFVIDGGTSLDRANCLEQKYIAEFNSNNPEFGYNLTSGGNVTTFSKWSKEKMSRSAKDRWKNNPEMKEIYRRRGIEKFADPELRQEYSKRSKRQWSDTDLREEHSKKMSARFEDTNFAEHMQKANKQRFDMEPELRKRAGEHLSKFQHLSHNDESIKKRINNRRKNNRCSSKYIGVCWYKSLAKWKACAQFNGKSKHLGYYDLEEEAARARDNFVKDHYLSKTVLNFE